MFTRFLPFFLILFSITASAAETYFEVTDNEGNSLFGMIVGLDRTQVTVDTHGERHTIPLEKVVNIRNLASSPYTDIAALPPQHQTQRPVRTTFAARSANERRLVERIRSSNEQTARRTFPESVVGIEFKDGSRLTASSFTIANGQAMCRLLEQQDHLSIPLEHLSAVRFAVRGLSEMNNPPADWLRLAVPTAEGDKLVVGSPGAFDVYAGILGDVSAETVSFDVDGEVLPIPRRRVYGIVLHGETVPIASPAPLATLTLWTGTQAMISDVQLDARLYESGGLTWQTTSGLTVTVPLALVSEINFGEQGVAHLFDFERVRNEFSLPFAIDIEAEQWSFLQTFLESRTRVPREIIMDGVPYERGITLKGEASLEYLLPKPFASLSAVIGIEDQFRPHASATLQILADSQVLGVWELRGDAAAQAIHLNLPQNSRLMTIIAEPIPQSGISAVVTIAEPKLFE